MWQQDIIERLKGKSKEYARPAWHEMALKLEKASAFFFGDVSGIDEVVERSGMSEPQATCPTI